LRLRRTISTALLCCLLLGGCADSVGEGVQGYVVRPQDTLYSIAWRHDLDFRDLARWNNIGPDFHISVGQVLALGPQGSTQSGTGPANSVGTQGRPQGHPQVASPSSSQAPSHTQSGGTPATPPSGPGAPAAASGLAGARSAPQPPTKAGETSVGRTAHASLVEAAAQKWVWPTDRVGAPLAVAGGGILLSGVLGQDVRAAGAGRVVYTGSGLRGYGNLVIIKHGDSLLSAYGHNREMLVREGQTVAAGQVIGHMGEGAHQAASLYFEIRLNGRPVDPLPLLPGKK
jgi:lipoprotein NlpD